MNSLGTRIRASRGGCQGPSGATATARQRVLTGIRPTAGTSMPVCVSLASVSRLGLNQRPAAHTRERDLLVPPAHTRTYGQTRAGDQDQHYGPYGLTAGTC